MNTNAKNRNMAAFWRKGINPALAKAVSGRRRDIARLGGKFMHRFSFWRSA
jgi:hypothetical protein